MNQERKGTIDRWKDGSVTPREHHPQRDAPASTPQGRMTDPDAPHQEPSGRERRRAAERNEEREDAD